MADLRPTEARRQAMSLLERAGIGPGRCYIKAYVMPWSSREHAGRVATRIIPVVLDDAEVLDVAEQIARELDDVVAVRRIELGEGPKGDPWRPQVIIYRLRRGRRDG